MNLKELIRTEPKGVLIRACLTALVALQIVLIPFPHITAVHEMSFYLSVLLFIILMAKGNLPFTLKTPLSVSMGLFTIWCIFGLFFALNLQNSIHDLYAHFVKYLIVFYLAIYLLAERRRFTLLVWGMVISMTLFAIGHLVYFYIVLGKPFSLYLFSKTPGEVSSNIIALLTLFAAILSIYLITESTSWRNKAVLSACLAALMITTLATQSRGAMLAVIASLLLSFRKNKKVILCLGLAMVLLITFMPVKHRLSPHAVLDKLQKDDRINIWYNYWEIIKDHPVLGVGFGMQTFYDDNFLRKYNDRVPEAYRNKDVYYAPHNTLVDLAARTGIVGLALFLGIMAAFVHMCMQIARHSRDAANRHWASCLLTAFTAVFIQGLFENTMSGPPAMILYTIFALGVILWKMEKETA